MSDDLEGVSYKSRLDESLRSAVRGRTPRRPGLAEGLVRVAGVLRRPMGVFLVVCGVLAGLALLLPPPSDRAAAPDVDPGTLDGGLLADLRGDDVLYRLVTTQAALEREMSFVRQWVSASEGVSSAAPDLARALSELEARHAEVAGLVRHLEASQMRLVSVVMACQTGLATLSETVEGLRVEERN